MDNSRFETAVVPQNKIVTEAAVARRLLKDGYKVIDIKPKKGSARESVFIFEVAPGFMEKLNAYISEHSGPKNYRGNYDRKDNGAGKE